MRQSFRLLIAPFVATCVGVVLLLGLGIWQLERLQWKEALIARIESAMSAEAAPLPSHEAWTPAFLETYDYRRVTLSGHFLHDKEAFAYGFLSKGEDDATIQGGFIVTPFERDDGSVIMVNRGFVPTDKRDPATRRDGLLMGPVTVSGIVRGPESKNAFTPADDPAHNLFFTRDPIAIASAKGLNEVAPFMIDADATPVPGGWPEGGHTIVALVNNHFQYALTWFALALGLLSVFFVFARNRLRALNTQAAH
jgi:surfeit locus 1 family protein